MGKAVALLLFLLCVRRRRLEVWAWFGRGIGCEISSERQGRTGGLGFDGVVSSSPVEMANRNGDPTDWRLGEVAATLSRW